MTLSPEELGDAALLASAKARLEMALGDPSPKVAALLQRLASEGTSDWSDAVLGDALGPAEGVVERVAPDLWGSAQAAVLEGRVQNSFLVGCAFAAVNLISRGVLPRETQKAGTEVSGRTAHDAQRLTSHAANAQVSADDLLDIASFLSNGWSDLFARAARVLRGDLDEEVMDLDQERPSKELLRGEYIGGYRLLEHLGRGSFGTVYRAVEPDLGRYVALKLLRPEVFSKKAEERFIEEGRILSSLSHPGIATLFAAGFDRHLGVRLPFLAMELVRGKSIVRYANEQDLDIESRIRLLIQACDALHHAHQSQVVHRDVHPGNLIVRDDGTLKVVDFGAAFAPTSRSHGERSGVLLGALSYISPEQAQSKSDGVDARADVFGLGAILFELLCGETPHDLADLTLQDALAVVTEVTPRRLLSVNPSVNRDLDAICAKALAEDQRERYSSALELGEDLRRFCAGLPVEARTPSFVYSMRKLARRHKREFTLLAIGSLLITGLSVGAILGWRRAHAQASDLAETQSATLDLVDSLVYVAETQADKLEQSWDSGAFYETWGDSLEPYVVKSTKTRPIFLELMARHAMFDLDFEQALDLREEVVACLENRRKAAEESGEPSDSIVSDLSKAIVRVGDTHWDPICKTGHATDSGAKIEAEVALVRELFGRALALDETLAERTPTAFHIDNLVWSNIRLFDFELRRGHGVIANEYLREAGNQVDRLLALDVERPHSHYAKAEIESRLYLRATREKDYASAVSHAKTAVVHASLAFNGERDRVPFMRTYQRTMANVSLAVSRLNSVEAVELTQSRTPLFVAMVLAGDSEKEHSFWRVASKRCMDAAQEYALDGQHYLAGHLYRESAKHIQEALGVEPLKARWVDELWIVRNLRDAAISFDLAGDLELAKQCRGDAGQILGDTRARGVDPEFLVLGEQLILRTPESDPCDLRDRLNAYRENHALGSRAELGATLRGLFDDASRRCSGSH